ncbi:hypothetical protein ZIOFF_009926 [Zingiber officinale]|uniref:DUF4216 domain-containing protein n=1 Tax=Zingiber officinale TaxID=94328 RepID=A0A8J5HYR0_ZINOF|nr:hypothetical protein ZIOFF_009926 [Zingiber officinale]
MAAKEQASAAHEAAVALPGNEQPRLVWQVHERSHTKRPLLRQATSLCLVCGRFEYDHVVARHEIAYDHLTVDGFIKGYTHWIAHGEIACSASINSTFVPSQKDADDMHGLVYETFGMPEHNDNIISTPEFENDKEIPTEEAEKFYKLIDDSQKELYPDYVETRFNQSSRNDDINIESTFSIDIFNISGYALGKAIATKFDTEILKKAHQYIEDANLVEDDPVSNDLRSIARGPNVIGIRYEKFISNGFRFHTKEVERKRKTQNCGVTVRATTSSYSSVKDHNPVLSELDYYGILQNVIELDYGGGRKVVFFECEWVSKGKRLKLDEDGFVLANFKNVRHNNEPYILASQAMQVFYVEDPIDCD